MKVQIHPSWNEVLHDEFQTPYFANLVSYIKSEYHRFPGAIFPKGEEIFRAFNSCPFHEVKVVILGQDPYPTRGHAHGLCFSCNEEVRPLPKSLNNIFQELKDDLGVIKETGDLSNWANQGVLLLNSVLTVREGEPGSHANQGWEKLTDAVIRELGLKKEGLVYILWGSYAQKKASFVDASKNLVLKTVHPSPLSAYRGFFGSKPFSKVNEYLEKRGVSAINW